ncbi:MAG TPA: flagellar biosynthesis protein FliQ [Thermotogota bacterium]|jgi:flagellar biosynthetic protein FliQ|nr:flagellar biosynthesis protein FliQ [Thermotogota bacterium]NLZ14165.1 flagellar biosynthesis protein FliQ [Thermotogaceae bacterium]MDD8041276.1 flagellar biosynthesis protein FliQ [Thermotogota bacterium]HNR63228.1 flagellar biosynthesis protein FliQ [Thermotogota bacterium]HNT96352.1 flagellar biosynthesis protein FliQ [Thermotogota bacterium]
MTIETFLDVFMEGIYVILYTIAPTMLLSLAVGLLIGIFQAVTQINDQTISFVPKVLVVFLSLVIFGGWIYQKLIDYMADVITYYMSLI